MGYFIETIDSRISDFFIWEKQVILNKYDVILDESMALEIGKNFVAQVVIEVDIIIDPHGQRERPVGPSEPCHPGPCQ